jgi:hypothetical protein
VDPWLLVVCAGLATFRLTRLVVRDQFPPIRWARERLEQGPEWLADLVACHWCASAYIAAGLVALVDLAASVPLPALVWVTAWAIGAWVADQEREPAEMIEPEDESEMATMEMQVAPNSHVRY